MFDLLEIKLPQELYITSYFKILKFLKAKFVMNSLVYQISCVAILCLNSDVRSKHTKYSFWIGIVLINWKG